MFCRPETLRTESSLPPQPQKADPFVKVCQFLPDFLHYEGIVDVTGL